VADADFEAMRARLDDAHAAAERLVREAERRAREDPAPPRGWDVPHEERAPTAAFGDLAALAKLLESVRPQLPPELARQLADAVRELLTAVRAVLDFAILRLERPAPAEREVRDIPIE
jgi:hypothetical protein